MKITKISSGQYKLSKEAWEEIGKKAGWHKKAQEDMIQLVALIDNDGKLINKGGYVIEGVGIFDAEDNAYPAGLNKLGELYASFVDQNNNVMTIEADRVLDGWNMGRNYMELLEKRI